jgi:hypothetical protein
MQKRPRGMRTFASPASLSHLFACELKAKAKNKNKNKCKRGVKIRTTAIAIAIAILKSKGSRILWG